MRDSRVTRPRKLLPEWITLFHKHCTKFEKIKRQIVGAEALLFEKHRTAAVQFDGQCNHKQKRKREEQTRAGNHHVLDAFDKSGYVIERLAHHTKRTNVAISAAVQYLKILIPLWGEDPK